MHQVHYRLRAGSGPDHGRVEFLVEDRSCLPAPGAAARRPVRLRLPLRNTTFKLGNVHARMGREMEDEAAETSDAAINCLDEACMQHPQLFSYTATASLHRRHCFAKPCRVGVGKTKHTSSSWSCPSCACERQTTRNSSKTTPLLHPAIVTPSAQPLPPYVKPNAHSGSRGRLEPFFFATAPDPLHPSLFPRDAPLASRVDSAPWSRCTPRPRRDVRGSTKGREPLAHWPANRNRFR